MPETTHSSSEKSAPRLITGDEFRFLREKCGFNRARYSKELSQRGKNPMAVSTLYKVETSDEFISPYMIDDLIHMAGERLFEEAYKLLIYQRERANAK